MCGILYFPVVVYLCTCVAVKAKIGLKISNLGFSQEKQDYDLGELMTHGIVDMAGFHALWRGLGFGETQATDSWRLD